MRANRSVLGAHQPIGRQQNDTSSNVTALGKMQSVDWTFFQQQQQHIWHICGEVVVAGSVYDVLILDYVHNVS